MVPPVGRYVFRQYVSTTVQLRGKHLRWSRQLRSFNLIFRITNLQLLLITVSLRWLMNVKDTSGRLARWALLLQQYHFEILHRPGKVHGNADGLSWRPYVSQDFNALQKEEPQVPKTRELRRCDLDMMEITDYLESDVLPSDDCTTRKILLTSDSFYIGHDGLLYH